MRIEGFCGRFLAFRRWDAEARGAVVKQARTTRHLWLVACDATMDPEDFNRRLWFRRSVCLFFEQPEARVTACRSTGSNRSFLERTYHYDSVSKSLQGNIENIDMSCGKRRGRPRKCTSSKCREVFARIGGRIKFGRLCVFRFYGVFLWFIVFFVLWFFVLWYVCVCFSFTARRG